MVDVNFTNIVKAIFRPFATEPTRQSTPELMPTLSVSSSEYQRLIDNINVPDKERQYSFNLLGSVEPIKDEIVSRKFDNLRMRELAPEISKASTIMVTSILSPNNLQGGSLFFNLDIPNIEESINLRIVKLISEHFKSIKLDSKLKQWLDDAIYNVGSRPVMILPEVFLTELIKKELRVDTKSKVGLEDLNNFEDKVSERAIYSSALCAFESIENEKFSQDSTLKSEIKIGLEQYFQPVDKEEHTGKLTDKNISTTVARVSSKLFKHAKNSNLLTVCEDPTVAGLASLKRSYTKKNNTQKLQNALRTNRDMDYKNEPFLSLDNLTYDSDAEIGNPLMMELPAESVIPIFTPGSPHEHIGYFVILDDRSNPINVTTAPSTEDAFNLRTAFNAVLGEGGLKELGVVANTTASFDAVNTVYEYMINQYITKSLKNMDIDNVTISKNPSIYKCMFRRLLEGKKTKLLFVPEELMVYIRFDHHSDGTGRSKLDAIKFALSLRITLLVSKILTVMEEAVVRERVNITLDDKVADPLRFVKMIKNRMIQSKLYDFTYDPDEINKAIARRGLSMMPTNIPGIEKFEISTENNNKSRQAIDDGLADETSDMVITGLGVPHSALNKLSEDEYSRSLATVDLLFSKDISEYQVTFCSFLNKLIQTYISYSAPLKEGILKILKEANITIDAEGADSSKLIDMKAIIKNVHVNLPAPNIAPDDAIFESFEKYENMLTNLVNSCYPEELFSYDRDLVEQMNMIKYVIKARLTRDYIASIGFSNTLDIPEVHELDSNEIVTIKKSIKNLAARLKNIDKITSSGDEGSEY